MTYAETLNYLYNTLPMFSRMGSAAFKKDLTNIRLLCAHLGNPHLQFKTVHVGGTNGKGSVSHMLAGIFAESGYKTGLYTSPHLYDFRERIRLNGAVVDEAFVIDFVSQHKAFIEQIEPSFFEITVAMAFAYFAEEKVDVAVIEVGLGGRLDSTNIILPELSIITNIGWDHMNLLGNTLPEIAAEKAGIIKPTVPVVIGEALPETKNIFQSTAAERSAPLLFAEAENKLMTYRMLPEGLAATYQAVSGKRDLQTDLPGIYQLKNLATVLTAVDVLNVGGWKLPDPAVAKALQNVRMATGLQGRWEVLRRQPMVVLEVAHNKDGIRQMLSHIGQLSYGKLHLVMGMVRDKDVDSVLALLPSSASYYFSQAGGPRALPGVELRAKAMSFGHSGADFPTVNEALRAALQQAAADDLVIVCGSIFFVAEVDRKLAL